MPFFVLHMYREIAEPPLLYTALFGGFLLAGSIAASVPIYTEAALSRVLAKNLENL